MTTDRTTGSSPTAAGDASLVELLREHAALRRDLIARLRGVVDAASAADASAEERTSALLGDVAAHLDGIGAEVGRRGSSPGEVEAWFALAAEDQVGLDLAHAIDAGLPGGTQGAAYLAWHARAQAGSAPAQHVTGIALLVFGANQGMGDDALRWLERAATAGSGPAAVALARFQRDPARSVELLKNAAVAGYPDACFQLAELTGRGAPTGLSVGEALELLETAARAGHTDAQLELGRIRATGVHGIESIDFDEARKWLTLAAARHRDAARDWLEKYGALDPASYRSTVWLASWTPTELPPAPRSGPIAMIGSLAIVALLVAAAWNGSSLGLFLCVMFAAVLMHEWGHFLAARLVGIPIVVFTVGVGPLVRSFRARGGRLPMRVDLRLLPLLGYVQPYVAPRAIWDHWQEQERCEAARAPAPPLPAFDTTEEPEPVFLHVSRPRRLAFLAGGLAVNLVAATAFLWLYETMSPVAPVVTSPEAGRVPPASVAAASGLREGDRFVSIDGEPVNGFFDVRRRLAPLTDDGAAAPLRDAPGTAVRFRVRRGVSDVDLTWTVPTAPPGGDAAESYGLLPPETWTIERRRPGSSTGVEVGDVVVKFRAGAREIACDAAGAHAELHGAFEQGPLELTVRRGGRELDVEVPAWRDEAGGVARAPFEFERKREVGARDGLLDVVADVGSIGWDSVIGLPREIAGAVGKSPSREEQGWLLAAVQRDPWKAAHLFGWFHAFLLFLNLVPIPPLDGFQLLCLGVESAAGRPLPRRGLAVVTKVGFVLLAVWLGLNLFLILRDAAVAAL